jgi:uncharacterized lipoprotein
MVLAIFLRYISIRMPAKNSVVRNPLTYLTRRGEKNTMNRIILLACIALIALSGGCATKHRVMANLNLAITAQPPVYGDVSAFIQGHDARKEDAVIVYLLKDQPPSMVPNMSPPHILATERLAGGFREQGLVFASESEVRILLDITELLVTVTKPKFLYNAEAKTRVTLKVVKGGTSLAKKYDREATQEFAQRPDISKAENMLNTQLSEIINQILKDEDIRNAFIAR